MKWLLKSAIQLPLAGCQLISVSLWRFSSAVSVILSSSCCGNSSTSRASSRDCREWRLDDKPRDRLNIMSTKKNKNETNFKKIVTKEWLVLPAPCNIIRFVVGSGRYILTYLPALFWSWQTPGNRRIPGWGTAAPTGATWSVLSSPGPSTKTLDDLLRERWQRD